MASEEPVRMLEGDTKDFELTELDGPEEELLGRYLPIGDVAKSIGVNPSVLRFWEQEFPQLRPTKRGNRRYYCSEDVALIRTIQHLLYEEHYTILGARNKIHELQIQNKVKGILDDKASAPLQTKPEKPALDLAAALAELKAIRAILDSPALEESRRQEQQAKEKADELGLDILFLCQKMENIDLYGTIDTCICTLDSINHLVKKEKVQKTFDKVSLFMNKGGYFLFDVNSLYKHQQVLGNNTFVYDTDDVFCVWQNSLSENNVVNIQLDFFCAMENGKDYRRYSENFSERAYSHEEIEEMLHNSGFETAAVYGDLSFEPPKPEEQRIIYVARKVK